MTLLSRISGLIRDIIFAGLIGAGSGVAADAFYVAFRIPNFLRRIFGEGAFSQSFVPVFAEFKAKFSYEPRLILLELIYQVIYSKGVVSPRELATAETIARFLDIFSHDHQTIQARYRKDEAAEERYYQILGVETGADWQTIKSAYRSMSMRYHPDKVGHLGEEFRKVAEDKMKEINAAYDYLKKKFAKDET